MKATPRRREGARRAGPDRGRSGLRPAPDRAGCLRMSRATVKASRSGRAVIGVGIGLPALGSFALFMMPVTQSMSGPTSSPSATAAGGERRARRGQAAPDKRVGEPAASPAAIEVAFDQGGGGGDVRTGGSHCRSTTRSGRGDILETSRRYRASVSGSIGRPFQASAPPGPAASLLTTTWWPSSGSSAPPIMVGLQRGRAGQGGRESAAAACRGGAAA